MKNLVLYASGNNTTEETVLRIKSHANDPIDIYKIKETGDLDLSIYSHIYIGTGIYGGRLPYSVTDPNKADTRKEETISELIKRF